jgi:hypothetical protein
MKNNPLTLFIAESFDRLSVTDKSGKTVFFPWGARKEGYYIKNLNVVAKAKKFYITSFYVFIIFLAVALSLFEKNFWVITGSIVVCFGSWYLVYLLYVSRITKLLRPARTSYNELFLSTYESEDPEEGGLEKQSDTKFPAQWSKPIPQTTSDPFSRIRRFLYQLPPGLLFVIYIFIGGGIMLIWFNFQHHKFGENPVDYLVVCIACVLFGLASFVVARNMESEEADWFGFLNWKLPMILLAAGSWIFAIISLYKFFVMIIA